MDFSLLFLGLDVPTIDYFYRGESRKRSSLRDFLFLVHCFVCNCFYLEKLPVIRQKTKRNLCGRIKRFFLNGLRSLE